MPEPTPEPAPEPTPEPTPMPTPRGPFCTPQPDRIVIMGMSWRRGQVKEVPRCVTAGRDGRSIRLQNCGSGLPAAERQLWLFTHTSSQIRWWKDPSKCLSLDLAHNASVQDGTRLCLAECADPCAVAADPVRQGFCVDTPVFDAHLGTRQVKSSCRGIPSTTPGGWDRNEETSDTKCLKARNPDFDGSGIVVTKCGRRAWRRRKLVWRYFAFNKPCHSRGGCTCDCIWSLRRYAHGQTACNSGSDDNSCCWGCCCNGPCKDAYRSQPCVWKQPVCPRLRY
mmetsp:Transcript_109545/g.349532  ORF Transcript_109545/g.349532 Transcript_109545/m.349532 type:complete len:280 (-) Transcript_109545:73-912(-)